MQLWSQYSHGRGVALNERESITVRRYEVAVRMSAVSHDPVEKENDTRLVRQSACRAGSDVAVRWRRSSNAAASAATCRHRARLMRLYGNT